MAQIYPLDRVIQRVDADFPVPKDSSQRLVTMDARTGRAVPRPRLFGWGEYRHYVVSNRNDPHHHAHLEFEPLRIPDVKHPVDVRVTAQVSCEAGNEEKLAEALFDPAAPPFEALERRVHGWLLDQAGDDVPAFVARCIHEREALQAEFAAALLRETGLRARFALALDAEDALKTERVDTHLAVAASDYDEEQDLGIRLDLEVDERRRAEAILHHPRRHELDGLVTDEVKAFIRRNVSLQEYADGFATGPVRDALVRHLNAVLAPVGRKAGVLVLQTKAVPVQPSPPREIRVRCKVLEYPELIVIANKVLLRLADMARYHSAGSPELDGWLRSTLDALVPQVLFDARYIDLLIRFGPWEERIRKGLEEAAEAIGYEIRHIITVPDLEQIRLRAPFPIEREGTFQTRLRNVEAKLQVVISACIPNLERIEDLLNRREDVRARMEEAVLAALRERLHAIEPERFYMRFAFTDPRVPGERQSVEAELTKLVRDRLQAAPFHAEVLSIVIKQLDTELAERFNRLQNGICPFSMVIESYHGGTVTLAGDFRVSGVDPDGWHLFQRLSPDIDAIGNELTTHLLSRLRPLRSEALTFREESERATIERLVCGFAHEFGTQQFGLILDVMNIRREPTPEEARRRADGDQEAEATKQIEQHARDARVTAAIAESDSWLAEHTELLGQRADAGRIKADEAEIAELDRRIVRSRARLGVSELPAAERARAALGEAAAAIGYEIRHTITVPGLEPVRREKPPAEGDGATETRPRNVEAKVQVVAGVRIPGPERGEEDAGRPEEVRARMEDAVLAALREELHAIDSERFYLRFGYADVRIPGEHQSVQAALTQVVRDRLQGAPFHAQVTSIAVRQLDTDLADRLGRLRDHVCPFSLVVESYHGGTVTLEGDFRVSGVEPGGWHRFQRLSLDLDAIGEELKTHLLSRMRPLRPETLTFREESERAEIERLLSGIAREFGAGQFGLTLEVTNIGREPTPLETQLRADGDEEAETTRQIEHGARIARLKAARAEHDSLVAELAELRKRRAEAVRMEADADEIADLDRKIRTVRTSLGMSDLSAAEQLRAAHLGTNGQNHPAGTAPPGTGAIPAEGGS